MSNVFKSIKERIRNIREETMTVKWYVKKSIYGDERKMAERGASSATRARQTQTTPTACTR